MRFKLLILILVLGSCKSTTIISEDFITNNADVVIAFGSCNKQNERNVLWQEIMKWKPDAWIWGGDIIYSDTDDMEKIWNDYQEQLNQEDYKKLQNSTKILGTWDDHDYGLNDGGEEFIAKAESQQLFLDFMGVSKQDERRQREGVYHSEYIKTGDGTINIFVLDTRYFRTSLSTATDPNKRYQPNTYGQGTILGNKQWLWFKNELANSKADFNIIVSSIQILSGEHGFETWANFPHEVDKLKDIIKNSKAKGVFIISGDRHISEFSKANVDGLKFPLIDFTSSGLTHSYSGFTSEPNRLRVGNVVSEKSFGLLKFNFKTKTVDMQMRGTGNELQQKFLQTF
ncbi:alkaline phosphatase D family protein [Algibacter sp.]